MTSRGRKFDILIASFVHSAIWSLCTSLPAKSAQLSPWDDDTYWNRRSTTRSWGRYTTSGDYNYKPRSSGTDAMFWLIMGGGILLGLAIVFLKYLCKRSESNGESSATLHPPPSRIIRPPDRATQPSQIGFRPQYTSSSNTPFGRSVLNPPASSSAGVSSTYGTGDRPPGYSEVVMSDFTEEKFPEVSPKPHETPPPKYDDGNLPRY